MRFSIATLLVTLVPLLGVQAAPAGDAHALVARNAAPEAYVGSIEVLDKRVPAQNNDAKVAQANKGKGQASDTSTADAAKSTDTTPTATTGNSDVNANANDGSAGIAAASEAAAAVKSAVADGEESANALQGE